MRGFACSVCVCLCVCERQRERVTVQLRVCVCVCVCVCALLCVREGDTVTQPQLVCKHIRASSLCLSRNCSPLRLELMVKLRTLLTIFIARNYGKGVTFLTCACGVWPITMLCVSWPIRAGCACWKEGLCRKQSV